MSEPAKQILTSEASLRCADSSESQAPITAVRVVSWPLPQIVDRWSDDFIDSALNHLYGYDWLVLINEGASKSFLRGLAEAGHDVSELDQLRVCAITGEAVAALEGAPVHIDVMPAKYDADSIVRELVNYSGQTDGLYRLNFLLPQAEIGQDYLRDALVNAGARADVVETYQTVADDPASLMRLKTVLMNGGIDCAVINDVDEVRQLATLFDTNDLGRLFKDVQVFVPDKSTSLRAAQFGLETAVLDPGESASLLPAIIETLFSS